MACDPLANVSEGRAFIVTDEENCQKELVQSEGGGFPALPVAESETKVVLRDGSVDQPISLPNLQSQTGGSFSRLLGLNDSGQWVSIVPPDGCLDKKIIARNGQFLIVDDVLPDTILASLCEVAACEDYDFLLGLKEETINCDGDDVTVLRLVKVPKDLCPECIEP